MFRVLKPPQPIDLLDTETSVFLAGSIEMGSAIDWQIEITNQLSDREVVVLNPRRDQWDAGWEQRMSNPMFLEQVQWELAGQEAATIIAMHFAPETKAPVTLLELGLFASSGKVIVSCPDGYWRKGNVEVVCQKFSIPLVGSLDELVAVVQDRLPRKTIL